VVSGAAWVAGPLAFASAALAVLGAGLLLPAGRRSASARRLLNTLGRMGVGPKTSPGGTESARPPNLAAKIAAAGRPGGLGPRELTAARLIGAPLAAIAATPAAALAPGRLGVAIVIAAPVVGFLAPEAWLAHRARERARQVRRELPAMLELLRVAVEAGSSLPAALGAVGARADGPLAAEWRAVAREVALGEPLERALDGLVARLPLPEVRALADALDRAARHGAPPAAALAAQARDARASLRRRVREDAARAGPKIQLVVALLLVPSVLLLVAAALLGALLDPAGGERLVGGL
jgi:tight adherence protein C